MLPINIIIIEKVPFVAETIQDAFNYFKGTKSSVEFKAVIENDFEKAFTRIKEEQTFDYYFVNFFSYSYQASNYKEKSTKNYDEKIAVWVRKHIPEAKIGVITNITSNYKLIQIIKKLNPDVFLIKQETWLEDLSKMVFDISMGRGYFSPMLRNIVSMRYDRKYEQLDNLDMRIVHHLSNGCPTNQLPKHIPLTISGIEKRKRKIAKLFGLNSSKSIEIVREARKQGII